MNRNRLLPAAALLLSAATPALADTQGPTLPPILSLGDGFSLKPTIDARARFEDVDQPAKPLSADAVTLRARAGVELTHAPSHLSILAEADGTLALDRAYNAFPYALPTSSQYRPARAVIADPESLSLNRLQIAYRTKALSLTVGRQRINLDDERWVGSAGWRQNEQTFDAVRATAAYGPFALDATYADSQRTIYGSEGGPRVAYDGQFWLLGGSVKTGPVTTKAFAYLLDYDPTAFGFQGNSSQTYGFRSAGSLVPAKGVTVSFVGSFAHQANWKDNPITYSADYAYAEAGITALGFGVKGGWEMMGSDPAATGGPHAVQTPMATFHKWDGWADQFLTTPAKGLVRQFATASYHTDAIKPLPGLTAQVTWHSFDSDIGNIHYGHEWDESLGFRTGRIAWLIKHAAYAARGAGTSTRKFWLQAEYAF